MQEVKKEQDLRVVERQFVGDQKLESLLFLWLKKQMDGEQE